MLALQVKAVKERATAVWLVRSGGDNEDTPLCILYRVGVQSVRGVLLGSRLQNVSNLNTFLFYCPLCLLLDRKNLETTRSKAKVR
ncbi:hypothetical protein PpBr36_03569 [Pyricularia pennisetigena]|uniref:hypothetical protein n=1 Tax=Pyricularia pennisetigena TaxID=1578925 RepID=UPI001150B359|nr:hypothetical protein PpBr36_03569 [Pyricularia pennisetigena]TLS31558.1 hypothetical protein PpBr36_03569 [Pyricularia pennisetigena]